jgi:uncharacterized protein involved in cysteine biosynthesis
MFKAISTVKPYFRQFLYVLNKHIEAVIFLYEHKLWRGILRYGWVSKFLVVLAVLIGIKMLQVLRDWWSSAHFEDPELALSSVGSLLGEVATESYSFLFAGSMKYVMLVLVEVIIFHFSRRTVEILTAKPARADFQEFVQAQFRMIKVALRSWIMEIIAVAIIGVVFSLFNFLNIWGINEVLKPALIFLAQSFFTGFAVVDNYNEQFRMPIRESFQVTKKLAGVSIGAGMVLQLLMPIPLVGLVFGSVLVAIAVVLAMFELTDLHKRTPTVSEEGVVPERVSVKDFTEKASPQN